MLKYVIRGFNKRIEFEDFLRAIALQKIASNNVDEYDTSILIILSYVFS